MSRIIKTDIREHYTFRIFFFILFITSPVIPLLSNWYSTSAISNSRSDYPAVQTPVRHISGTEQKSSQKTEQKTISFNKNISACFKTLENFPKKSESFFNKNFPFRTEIVSTYNYYAVRYLKKSSNDKVIIGKDGWFFYKGDNRKQTIDDYTGRLRFSDEELEKIRARLEGYGKNLEDKKIKLFIVIAPNKESIYSEYMPEYYIRAKGSRLKQITQYLSIKSPEINIIDLTNILLKKKISGETKYPLYYKTDTHWNDAGAYIVSSNILQHLNLKIKNIKFFTPVESIHSGDIAITMLNCADQITEKTIFYEPLKNRSAKKIKINSNTFITVIENKNLPKAIIFGDSFSSSLQPYLSEHFSKTIWIWGHKIDMNLIEEEKPDFVIIELVERYLDRLLNI